MAKGFGMEWFWCENGRLFYSGLAVGLRTYSITHCVNQCAVVVQGELGKP